MKYDNFPCITKEGIVKNIRVFSQLHKDPKYESRWRSRQGRWKELRRIRESLDHMINEEYEEMIKIEEELREDQNVREPIL